MDGYHVPVRKGGRTTRAKTEHVYVDGSVADSKKEAMRLAEKRVKHVIEDGLIIPPFGLEEINAKGAFEFEVDRECDGGCGKPQIHLGGAHIFRRFVGVDEEEFTRSPTCLDCRPHPMKAPAIGFAVVAAIALLLFYL